MVLTSRAYAWVYMVTLNKAKKFTLHLANMDVKLQNPTIIAKDRDGIVRLLNHTLQGTFVHDDKHTYVKVYGELMLVIDYPYTLGEFKGFPEPQPRIFWVFAD